MYGHAFKKKLLLIFPANISSVDMSAHVFITELKGLHPHGDWVRLASQESSANLRTTACRTHSDDIVTAARSKLLLLWSIERGDFKHEPALQWPTWFPCPKHDMKR